LTKKYAMKKLLFCLTSAVFFIACSHSRVSQEVVKTAAQTDSLVDGKSFQFTAQNVQPLGGRSRILTTLYFVRVNNDKLQVDLPYFGKAYTASINASASPLRFESTEFVYQVEKKKDGRTLMIQPRGTDVRQLQFTIYDNGTAYLNVVSNSRQAINFTGYLQTLPVPKQTTNP